MHLVRLHLRNFKRYRDQEVLFRDGITGILGNNGSGKSTIVDAILFTLYGIEKTGLEKKHIVRATAGPRARAEVRLEFSVRGEDYTIVRTLGPKTQHTAQLNHGQKLLATGVTDVDNAIRDILHMGPQDFMHTIFSAQKDLAALLDATPGSRKAWFRKVLGIDALKDRGGETLRQEVVDAVRRATLIEGRLQEADPEVLLRQRGEVNQVIATLEDRVRAQKEEQSTLDARRTTLEADLLAERTREKKDLVIRNGILAGEAEVARIGQDITRLQEEIVTAESHMPEFQELTARERDLPSLKKQFDAISEKFQRFQDLTKSEEKETTLNERLGLDLRRLRDEIEQLEKDEVVVLTLTPAVERRGEVLMQRAALSQNEEKYHALRTRVTKIEGELETTTKRGVELRSRIERMNSARERLAALASPWTAAEGERADPDAVIALLEARRRDIRDAVSDLRADHEQAALRKAEVEEQLAGITARGPEGPCPTCRQSLGERFGDLVRDLQEEIRKNTDTVGSMAVALKTAGQELSGLEAVIGEAQSLRMSCAPLREAQKEWEDIQDHSLRLLAEKEDLDRQRDELGYTPQRKQSLEQELGTLEDTWKQHLAATERLKRLPALRKSRVELGEERDGILQRLDTIRREREQLAFDPAEHQRLEREIQSADEAHKRFLAMRSDMDRIPQLRKQAADLRAQADEAEAKLRNHRVELAALAFSPQDLERLNGGLQQVQENLVRIAGEIQACRSDLAHSEEERHRIAEELLRLEKDRADLDRLREGITLLEMTRKHLNGFTDHLLGVVRDQVQAETGRVLSEITDGRYDTVLVDDGFELLVHDLGGDFPVSRFSGGEQDDVAIALRIALSRYIAGMHELHDTTFLIFDEIFGSQDEVRRGNIFRALRTMEPYFSQIFLISHVAEVQGEFANTMMVEAVSDGESRIRDLEGGGP